MHKINIENERERMNLLSQSVDELSQILVEIYADLSDTAAKDSLAEGAVSLKKVLLMASILRVTQMKESLAPHLKDGFAEELWIAARVMFEFVTNTAYLQSADDSEVNRYTGGDAVVAVRGLKAFEGLSDSKLDGIDDNARAKMQERAQVANGLAGEEIHYSSWSKMKLEQRAQHVDKQVGNHLYELAYREVYNNGNLYVHGRFTSLAACYQLVVGEWDGKKESRLDQINVALSQISKVMFLFCFFVNSYYTMNFEPRLSAIIEKQNASHALSGMPPGNFTF